MSDAFLDVLRTVVRPQQHLALRPDGHVHLDERPPATLTSVRINCLGCIDVFAFTLDVRRGGAHVPLTNHTTKGVGAKWNKVCDGVFVWRSDSGELRVLLCDLKSSTPTGSDWKNQLWSSGCFVKYLFAVAQRFHDALPTEANPGFYGVTFHGNGQAVGRGKRVTGVPVPDQTSNELNTPTRMPVQNGDVLVLKALGH